MKTDEAIRQIADLEVKKVDVRLSLSGVSSKVPLVDCLWPRVTFECNGKTRTHPFTYWHHMAKVEAARANVSIPQQLKGFINYHTLEEVVFLSAGLRPTTRPVILVDVVGMKAKKVQQQVQQKLIQATHKVSFRKRYQTLMRKLERAEGKKRIRELILSMPQRMEKRDVIEAWHEAVVQRVMDS